MQVSCSANSVLLLKRILKLTLKTTFRHCFPSSRAHENNEELHRRVVFLLISLLTFPFHSLSFEILLTPTISGNSDHYKVVNQSWCLFSFWIWGLTSVFKNEHTHTHTHPREISVLDTGDISLISDLGFAGRFHVVSGSCRFEPEGIWYGVISFLGFRW